MPWKSPPCRHERLGRTLDVEDAGAGRHPLGVAVGDEPPATGGVLVLEGAVDHVGHGLEAPMGVPRRPPGLAGPVLDLTHLVHVHEGVELGQVDPGEGAPHREPLALVPRGRVGHRHHRSLLGRSGIGGRQSGQGEDVLDGHSRHGAAPRLGFMRSPSDAQQYLRTQHSWPVMAMALGRAAAERHLVTGAEAAPGAGVEDPHRPCALDLPAPPRRHQGGLLLDPDEAWSPRAATRRTTPVPRAATAPSGRSGE